jgi:hypothetical protein
VRGSSGWGQFRRGGVGAGPDQAGELGVEVRKHGAKGIWSGWCG